MEEIVTLESLQHTIYTMFYVTMAVQTLGFVLVMILLATKPKWTSKD